MSAVLAKPPLGRVLVANGASRSCRRIVWHVRSFSTDTQTQATATKSLSAEQDSSPSLVKAYLDLSKARLSSLVVATTAAGFVAAGGPLNPVTLSAACVGTALCSSSASALNQIIEMDRDAKMKRTQQRPLVKGVLTKEQGQLAAATFAASGTSILALGTDPVTTMLGASNIALYAGLYTYMKPRSKYNTWVGAVVGAIPPVMGWTASGGSIMDVEALLLGSTLYLWQMPHFFALSYMHRVDYKRGGFAMVPVLEENGDETASLITRYTWYLSSVPFVATLTDVTSSMFALEGVALNAYALHVAYKFRNDRTNANARKVFLTSLWYLPSLLMLFLLHSKTWDDEAKDDEKDVYRKLLSEKIHYIRDAGRQMCIHEKAINSANVGSPTNVKDDLSSACPVSLGMKTSEASVQAAADAVVSLQDDRKTNK
eukprot:CAMPEP_0195298372 /NCGR_PEP_ID=MMETSP0707-20130614/23337_1 /TAXON_ID=33640 /ORGANISM="Asterionellopsis glacialis, Strain CCMP134" /LENGTH=427 /DNA_ID=CAMNT_0040360455 /DNA_START=102 /DNA_END=1385 /DNA_ORIENTATION=+